MVVPGMIRRRKKVEADMPGKRLFLCSFINLLVLESPVGGVGVGGGEDVVPCFKDLINLSSKYFLSL